MKERLISWWSDRSGNDMVEYALLMAFICLAGAAVYVSMANNTSSMWSTVNSRLAANQGS